MASTQAATSPSAGEVKVAGPFVLDAETERWVTEQSAKAFGAVEGPPASLALSPGCWRRYELTATADKIKSDLWLVITSLERRTEALLVLNNRVMAAAAAGYAVPMSKRGLPVQDLALPLDEWREGTATIYVHFPLRSPPVNPPKVRNTAGVLSAHNSGLAFDFAYFGAFAMLLIVRGGLFAFYRDRATRDYVFLTIGLMLGVVGRAGYWDIYLAPQLGAGFLLGDYRYLIRIINSVLAWRTVNSFFDFRRTAPRLDRAMQAATWSTMALILLSLFVSSTFKVAISGMVQLLASLLVISGCWTGIRRKLPGAYSFSLGWAGIVFLTVSISAHALGMPFAIEQELLTQLTILALLWENTVNTIVITLRFRRLQSAEYLAAVRGQQSTHRQQLLRLLSHDVANPAAAIKTSVWLLRRSINDRDSAKTIENADRIDAGVKEIFDIVGRVRTLESGPAEFSKGDPVNVVEVINTTLAGFHPRIEAKGLSVKTRFESKEVNAYADKVLLGSSVLANAFSNAIKFSHRGGIIEVNVSTLEANVLIVIRDFGVGIPIDDRRKLEDLAIPLPSRPGTEKEDGSGFGLQIMYNAAQRMGGSVVVRSNGERDDANSVGTTIVISLRLAK